MSSIEASGEACEQSDDSHESQASLEAEFGNNLVRGESLRGAFGAGLDLREAISSLRAFNLSHFAYSKVSALFNSRCGLAT